ncbi:hypothetical protein NHX12_000640, partial [Muraenolepis orangiensis]
MVEALAQNTNEYSFQERGTSVNTTAKEIEKMLGMYLKMGLVQMAGTRMYWETETRYSPVADVMPRNRFQSLLTSLHFVNNMTVSETEKKDKLWKLRLWLDSFREKCLQVVPEEHNSVDEMMIPFKGKFSSIKQYMRGKPNPWGFKVWVRTGISGMMCDFDVYQGSVNGIRAKSELGLSVECQHNIKSHLMQKFRRVFEGIAKAGQSTDLNDFYTELFITEGVSGEVNKEHEVSLIETASRKPAKEETPIKLEDIFKPLPGQDQPSRTIMTTGVAGIGKTILTHKFTLDWAEGKANHDIHFTLPFTFRELNLLKEKEFSLMELLQHFFIQTKGIRRYDPFQVVFILDGLDECRLPLDFQNNPIWTDVTKSTSVDILLTNLIRGDLLPSARIWITTRPAAANQIPAECVDMVTEVRGFTDPQKEEYFRKRFREEPLASRIISHIKTSRSLHIMCHIP